MVRQKDRIVFTFHGTGFLQNMVRILVGTLLEVGRGTRQPEDMPALLEARDRRLAGPTLFAVYTPQVIEASLLKAALQSAIDAGAEITDDCSAVERLGKKVYLATGSRENIKITTPLDLLIAEAILRGRDR